MNELRRVLEKSAKEAEQRGEAMRAGDPYRLKFHLMPPAGWLNDPNGLCWFKGRYHVFFQYSPFDAAGGLKLWGHYASADLLSWEYLGVSIWPDSPQDLHGVYSGSALEWEGELYLFYTGNVKLEGDYDYIYKGRRADTLCVRSRDGVHFGHKQVVIRTEEYPKDYTCHIRDPKVWREQDAFYMILGGRKKDGTGGALIYSSQDLYSWKLEREIVPQKPLGYMWECPDQFPMEGKEFLSLSPQGLSPQGLSRERFRFQNIYQSGYLELKDGKAAGEFHEWDKGFDFYAPQTFAAPGFDGTGSRRILFGWMSVPESEKEYENPTVNQGWQHALTVPREITRKEGRLLQQPARELSYLWKREDGAKSGEEVWIEGGCFELISRREGLEEQKEFLAELGAGDLRASYRDGIFSIQLSEEAGWGRKIREARVEKLTNVRILADTSAVEIFVNDGFCVFSTRYYPVSLKEKGGISLRVTAEGMEHTLKR